MGMDQISLTTICFSVGAVIGTWTAKAIFDALVKAAGLDQAFTNAAHASLEFMRRWMPISLLVLVVSVSSSLLTAWVLVHTVFQRA